MDTLTALSMSADLLVKLMGQEVDGNNLPKAIKDATSITPPKKAGGTATISVIIDLAKAPMAGAFEYGSGLHSTRGPQKKYTIPASGDFVAFPAERWPGYRPPPAAPNTFVFTFVSHPGVVAKPYLRPAIEKGKPAFRKLLASGFRVEIMRGVKKLDIIK